MKTLIKYGNITLRDLVGLVEKNKKKFPKGLDTPITCGDYEGNYCHEKMSVEAWSDDPSETLDLSFELHDSF